MFLLPLLTFPHFVHFIDVHDCEVAEEAIMRQDVSQQTEGAVHMACGARQADKNTAIEDNIGKSVWSRDGAGNVPLPFIARNLRDVLAHFTV